MATETSPNPDPITNHSAGEGVQTLNEAAKKWLGLGTVDDPQLEEAIALLENDASLLEPVLAWCRTRSVLSKARVTSARRAVIMLGVPSTRAAVVGVSAVGAIENLRIRLSTSSDAPPCPVDHEGFWTHALAVASLCEILAERDPDLDADTCMLAGLLHDIGSMVLACAVPEQFGPALDDAARFGKGLATALTARLGHDQHTEGKRLIERWGLSESVRDAAWHHSQPLSAVPRSADGRVVGLVTLAKAWAAEKHLGWSVSTDPAPDVTDLAGEVGIEPAVLDEVLPTVIERVRERARALGLGDESGVDPIAWCASDANRRSTELASKLRESLAEQERVTRTLKGLDHFRQTVDIEAGASSVVSAIGVSAAELLGVGRVAVVWQVAEKAPWSLTLVGADGTQEQTRDVDAPPADARLRRPAEIAVAHPSQVLVACELGWLARLIEHLREAGTPALVGAGAKGDERGASCLALAPVPLVTTTPEELAPVTEMWAWALNAASQCESATRVSEELAQANRNLAAMQEEMATKASLIRLGQMAAGAAHELNNPLTVIKGRSQMLYERADGTQARTDTRAIMDAAQQLSDTITSLHLLANPPEFKPTPCDPMLVLRDAADRARAKVSIESQKSRVRIEADGALGACPLDRELVAAMLSELIANGMQAKPGGEVHISIQSEAFTDRLIVRVRDRGPGLTARAMRSAFEPFFSELPAGRRAGLGLARANSLAELMGGTISLDNNPGELPGAYAEVSLPTNQRGHRAA